MYKSTDSQPSFSAKSFFLIFVFLLFLNSHFIYRTYLLFAFCFSYFLRFASICGIFPVVVFHVIFMYLPISTMCLATRTICLCARVCFTSTAIFIFNYEPESKTHSSAFCIVGRWVQQQKVNNANVKKESKKE